MTHDQFLRKYAPVEWAKKRRESQRKRFESDEELDRRLLVADMVKKARRLIRKAMRTL